MDALLDVQNICCDYEGLEVISQLSFSLQQGDIACLLGPSGCGKTTVLRAIAGFHPLKSGTISLDKRMLSGPHLHLPPEQREIGMVFQDYALFPHLNVKQNIEFGLRKLSGPQRKAALDHMLSLIKLEGLQHRYPHELSGGQQQRIALARALAPQPRLLVLDEPFSNLDVELRKQLQLEVRDILKQTGISAILVTHDQEEAFAFADQIGLLKQGTLQQWSSPYELYHRPQTPFAAHFIGQGRFIPGIANGDQSVSTELGMIRGHNGQDWPQGTRLNVLIRPDDIFQQDDSPLKAVVENKVFSGSATLYSLRLTTGSQVQALLASHLDYPVGATIAVAADIRHLITFPPE